MGHRRLQGVGHSIGRHPPSVGLHGTKSCARVVFDSWTVASLRVLLWALGYCTVSFAAVPAVQRSPCVHSFPNRSVMWRAGAEAVSSRPLRGRHGPSEGHICRHRFAKLLLSIQSPPRQSSPPKWLGMTTTFHPRTHRTWQVTTGPSALRGARRKGERAGLLMFRLIAVGVACPPAEGDSAETNIRLPCRFGNAISPTLVTGAEALPCPMSLSSSARTQNFFPPLHQMLWTQQAAADGPGGCRKPAPPPSL